MPTTNIVPILQTAIGPMILISAIGLLLLTMTNRIGRTIDRARALGAHDPEPGSPMAGQLSIIYHRARLLRMAILCASASALCGALLIIGIFVSALVGILSGWLIIPLFGGAMVALIAALVLFMRDVNLSLKALKVELEARRRGHDLVHTRKA